MIDLFIHTYTHRYYKYMCVKRIFWLYTYFIQEQQTLSVSIDAPVRVGPQWRDVPVWPSSGASRWRRGRCRRGTTRTGEAPSYRMGPRSATPVGFENSKKQRGKGFYILWCIYVYWSCIRGVYTCISNVYEYIKRTGGISCGSRLRPCASPLRAAISRHPHPSTDLTSPGTPLVSRDCIKSKWPARQRAESRGVRLAYLWVKVVYAHIHIWTCVHMYGQQRDHVKSKLPALYTSIHTFTYIHFTQTHIYIYIFIQKI